MSERELNNIIARNITKQLEIHNKTQLDLAEYMNVTQATVSNWCQGIKMPRMTKIDMICSFFSINRSDLMNDAPTSAKPMKLGVTINVLGRVAAGIPIEAVENIIDTEEITEDLARSGSFFGLRIQGDSMEPDIHNGDTVIVRQQDDAETDEIVIALINGNDGVCKRLIKYKDSIALTSNNPKYAPMYFSEKDIAEKPVKIIGKVVELRRKM